MKFYCIGSLLGFLLMLLSLACNDGDSNAKNYSDTSLLNNYLLEMTGQTIAEKQHLYVIVPSQGCFGCMQKSIMAFSNLLDSNLQVNTTMIVSNRNKDVLSAIPEGIHTIQDSLRKIDQLSLSLSGVRFIKSKFKVVMDNQYFAPEQLHKLQEFIRNDSSF